jgi:hypothetical protein
MHIFAHCLMRAAGCTAVECIVVGSSTPIYLNSQLFAYSFTVATVQE